MSGQYFHCLSQLVTARPALAILILFLAGRARNRVGPEPGTANDDQVRHHEHSRVVWPQGRPQPHQDRARLPLRLKELL